MTRTKTPVLENGNHTYRLTHTRFLPPQTPQIAPSVPLAVNGPSATPAPPDVPPSNDNAQTLHEYRGFYRDQTIGAQIIEVIGEGPWEKRVLPLHALHLSGNLSRC